MPKLPRNIENILVLVEVAKRDSVVARTLKEFAADKLADPLGSLSIELRIACFIQIQPWFPEA